jgi:alkylation response protein AidB-like acyl-CoA dehydrogenase
VRTRLAELEMELEVARLLTVRIAAMIENKKVPNVEGSVSKVFTSELRAKMADWGTQMFGLRGQLAGGEHAPMGGGLVQVYRGAPIQRFGGGTNEVQRNIIAQRGLGLPRGPNDPADRRAQAKEASAGTR